MKKRNQLRKMLSKFVFKTPKGKSKGIDVLAAHMMNSSFIWAFTGKK